jgi:Uncharacterised nucleotidyltransferase
MGGAGVAMPVGSPKLMGRNLKPLLSACTILFVATRRGAISGVIQVARDAMLCLSRRKLRDSINRGTGPVTARDPQPPPHLQATRPIVITAVRMEQDLAAAIDTLLCCLLRGESVEWPLPLTSAMQAAFMERATFHGVEVMLLELVQTQSGFLRDIQEELKPLATGRAMWELRHRSGLNKALAALAAEGIVPLLFKGTAVAYSIYANPVWRTRADTDMLIMPDKLASATRALVDLGYQFLPISAELVFYQMTFSLYVAEGVEHQIDLHWQISNSEMLSSLFSYRELGARATALAALSPLAQAVSLPDALLIACMHSAVHDEAPYTVNDQTYQTGARLIWLYDIHLLATMLSEEQWQEVYKHAREKGLGLICVQLLQQVQHSFRTALPENWQTCLTQGSSHRASHYLRARGASRLWLDFWACRNRQSRAAFIGNLLFPPKVYMLHKYADSGHRWLPWLYLHRMCKGVSKYLHNVKFRRR